MACGVITGAGSVIEALRLRPGDSIVVLGPEGAGLTAVMAARVAGATLVAAVDVSPGRLSLEVLDQGVLDAEDGVLAADRVTLGKKCGSPACEPPRGTP